MVLEILLSSYTHTDLSNFSYQVFEIVLREGSQNVITHVFFKLNLCYRMAETIAAQFTVIRMKSKKTASFPDMLLCNMKRLVAAVKVCLDRQDLQAMAKQVKVLPSFQALSNSLLPLS